MKNLMISITETANVDNSSSKNYNKTKYMNDQSSIHKNRIILFLFLHLLNVIYKEKQLIHRTQILKGKFKIKRIVFDIRPVKKKR